MLWQSAFLTGPCLSIFISSVSSQRQSLKMSRSATLLFARCETNRDKLIRLCRCFKLTSQGYYEVARSVYKLVKPSNEDGRYRADGTI